MAQIFISHSSQDKNEVRKLAIKLRDMGISVWLDEWDIEVGESISEKVQAGLRCSSYVAVWLTKNSVKSGWVTKEWHAKIYCEISNKEVFVLPLLAEECEMPVFLSDKKYADFRSSFDEGLSSLLRAVSKYSKKSNVAEDVSSITSIYKGTLTFLDDLEESFIPLPTNGKLRIIKSLKALPRSGKLLRLDGFNPSVRIRSVYDHLLSVAHSADCLLPYIGSNIEVSDRVDLARLIAYHDICEVILGDIPQYTKLNREKRNKARIVGAQILSKLPEGEPERVANEFIALFLQGSERDSMFKVMELRNGNTNIKKMFYALDKIDPIVSVWRYINYFRNIPNFPIGDFINRLRHFFENPNVIKAVLPLKDNRMNSLVEQLQTPENARKYFSDKSLLSSDLFALPEDSIRNLIEGRSFEFTN